MAVGCFDPPTFFHSPPGLSSIWSNNTMDDQNNSESLNSSFRRQTSNNELFFNQGNSNPMNNQQSTSCFGAIGQPLNGANARSCWSPINNSSAWKNSANNWINAGGDQTSSSSDDRADSAHSESLASPFNSPHRNPWAHDESGYFVDPSIKNNNPAKTIYDAYNTDNDYNLFQDLMKLNIDDSARSASYGSGLSASSKSSSSHLNGYGGNAPSPVNFVDQSAYFNNSNSSYNHHANNNHSNMNMKRSAFSPVSSEMKMNYSRQPSSNIWSNSMPNTYQNECEMRPRMNFKNSDMMQPPEPSQQLPLSPPAAIRSHKSSSCDEAELNWYHQHLELQQSIYEHVYNLMVSGQMTNNYNQRSSFANAAAGSVGNFSQGGSRYSSSYGRRNNGLSVELQQRLEEVTEQYRQLEKERKKTEAELARHNLGKKISSANNLPIPRLPPAPSRIDRLVVDFFREHARVVTLLGKMEHIQNQSLDNKIHDVMRELLNAVRGLQQCRLSERCAILNHLRGEIGSYNEEMESANLLKALSSVCQAVIRARAANWCALVWAIGPENFEQEQIVHRMINIDFNSAPPEIKLRPIKAECA